MAADKNTPLTRNQVPLIERRKNQRVEVKLDIEVGLPSLDGSTPLKEKTVASNISPGDMYFETSLAAKIEPGDVVEVEIDLPVRWTGLFADRRLQVRGRVVRLGPPALEDPSRRGIAIIFLHAPIFHTALA
jgi:hypothetical protein